MGNGGYRSNNTATAERAVTMSMGTAIRVTGGVPTVRNWLVSMLAGDAGWTNVVADDFGKLLPGDPRANPSFPPVAPFDLVNGRVVCP